MVKKNKREKVEEVSLEIEPFDRRKYFEKEVNGAKRSFVATGLGLGGAVFSFVGHYFHPILGLIVGIIPLLSIKLIWQLLGFDLTEVNWKSYLGIVFIYLFSWLALSLVLMNPPVADMASPDLRDITMPEQEITPAGIPPRLEIRAHIVDNVDITSVHFEIWTDINPPVEIQFTEEDDIYHATIDEAMMRSFNLLDNGTSTSPVLNYKITAEDGEGLTSVVKNKITIFTNQGPTIAGPVEEGASRRIEPETNMQFTILDNCRIHRVYYVLGPTNSTVRILQPHSDDRTTYEISLLSADHMTPLDVHLYAVDTAGNRAELNFTLTA